MVDKNEVIGKLLYVLFGAIGAWLLSIIKDWLFKSYSDAEKKLKYFYSPLYFAILHNKQCILSAKKIGSISSKEYDSPLKYAEEAREQASNELGSCIELQNKYFEKVVQNNEEIYKIMQSNLAYADLEDIPLVQEFLSHYVRFQIENNSTLPWLVRIEMGEIQISSHKFYERIELKYNDNMQLLTSTPWKRSRRKLNFTNCKRHFCSKTQ